VLTRLHDGTRILIRPIRPADRAMLAAGHERLSPQTQHRRYLAAKPRLSSAELRYLTEVDGDDHVAYVAVLTDQPERLVAVGRYVRRADDPATAEVAITVGDELQGKGLGTRLGLLLADHARERGVKRFTATMLADNLPAQRLFTRLLWRLRTHSGAGVSELVGELAA